MQLSRSMQQSAVGLLVLVALGAAGLLILWVQNFRLSGRSYEATVQFSNAGGVTTGTPVTYRGVRVGQVLSVQPQPTGVDMRFEISPADRLIPRDSIIEIVQSGLVGEAAVDITPLQGLPASPETIAPPLDPNCDPSIIICNGVVLDGEAQLDLRTLIGSLLELSEYFNSEETREIARTTAENASNALREVAELSEEVTQVIQTVQDSGGIQAITSTIESADATLKQLQDAIVLNEDRIATTLDSIRLTSDQLRVTVNSFDPVIAELGEVGELGLNEFVENLTTLSENAAEASANLNDFSTNLNDPATLLLLQQTLDSARAAFQNLQKITSDVDELTGNPEFRDNIQELIDGLNNLLSSTQQLYQQVEYGRVLESVSENIATATDETGQPVPPSSAPCPPPTARSQSEEESDAAHCLP